MPFVRSARGLLDPVAERRLRQAQIARRGRDRLALIEDQSYRPRLVVIREAPPRPPALRVRHGRHRIPLSEDVHQTGSSPPSLATKAKGATFKQVNRQDIGALRIPVPPVPEQKRIAGILDKADALRAKRRAALAQLDTLTQSIFLDMFGNPATNPKGWPYSRLGDVTDFYAGSTLPAGAAFDRQADGYFLLKVSDMNLAGNEVYLESCQQWSAEPGAASSTCPAASIVIPKRGGAIGTNKKRIAVRPSVLDPNLIGLDPFGGHLPKGEYDVDHDGHEGQADAAELHG